MLATAPQHLKGSPDAGPARPLRRSALTLAACFLLVALIALADRVTGFEIRLAILYLLPIGVATWVLGGIAGTVVSCTASLCWLLTFATGHPYSHDIYVYWEALIAVVSFLIVVTLLTRLKQALAHSDERFVTVLDGLAAAVFVEDARSGQVLFTNPGFRRKFGDTRPRVLPQGSEVEYGGEIHDSALQRWYLVRSRPLRWIDGRAVTLRMLSDITEEKRVHELMDRHRDAVHRSARLVALGEFASAIAHEINQPLAAIATYNNTCLRLLEAGRGEAVELRAAMERCREQARRAGDIIKRLRGLLRHPTPAFAEQDLNEIARASLQSAVQEALEADVSLELELAPSVPPVRADSLLIEQVLLNLVRNAIDAVRNLPAARRRVTVGSAANQDGSVTVSVSDPGEGVVPEIRERLFDAFVTNKPGGLGLGLSICRSVIESHDGAIVHQANAGRGARFAFTLPGARS